MTTATATPASSEPAAETSGGGLDARFAALDLLTDVLRRNRPFDDALAARDELDRLEARDRGFVRMLAATTLRRLGQIDDLIARFVDKPLPDNAHAATQILRLGMCQILFLGTPAHAAVDTAVRMAVARRELDRYKGLINAVLRRTSREGAELVAAQDAARLNTPGWLWDSWVAAYGEATARAVAEAHQGEPPLDLTVAAEPEKWAAALGATILPTGTLRLRETAPVPEMPGFADGAWWVQDAGAALPVRLLARAFGDDLRGKSVADICAAPGGKTAQLAAMGARVTALDRSPARLKRVRDNLTRLNLSADIAEADAVDWTPGETFDAVLIDAPCSATGTIRRHPDLPWLKTANDVPRLAALQTRLLAAAPRFLSAGGVLVYCVCSLQPEEGKARVDEFLAATPSFRRLPVTVDDVAGIDAFVTPEGDMATLPFHLASEGGIDGFYAARLIKAG